MSHRYPYCYLKERQYLAYMKSIGLASETQINGLTQYSFLTRLPTYTVNPSNIVESNIVLAEQSTMHNKEPLKAFW